MSFSYTMKVKNAFVDLLAIIDKASDNSSDEPLSVIENWDKFTREELNFAFLKSCKKGNLAFVKKFLDKGADISVSNDAALFIAFKSSTLEMIRYLLEQMPNKETLFITLSIMHNRVEILEQFLDCAHLRDNLKKYIAFAQEEGSLDTTTLLVMASKQDDNMV